MNEQLKQVVRERLVLRNRGEGLWVSIYDSNVFGGDVISTLAADFTQTKQRVPNVATGEVSMGTACLR
jgi:hypothetical protein